MKYDLVAKKQFLVILMSSSKFVFPFDFGHCESQTFARFDPPPRELPIEKLPEVSLELPIEKEED